MGLSLGGSYSSANSSTTSSSSENKTFSAPQTGIQNQLGSNLSSDLSAANTGTLSPGVQAQKTQGADAINTESSGLQGRMQSFLAQRGFGKSGQSGKTALSGELGRQSALGNNEANFAQVQQNNNQSNLLAALNYAFTQMGTTAAGQSDGSSSSWGVKGGVST